MSRIFFTSDTHFGSERTLKQSLRPFKTVEEMDEHIIENWNNTVDHGDTVYHLGDFGDFRLSNRLNGNIIFIVGNHEMKYFGDKQIKYKFDTIKRRYNFKEVCYQKYLTINDLNLFMTHKPSDFCRKSGYFTLFGHLHRLCMIKSFGLNVGQDAHFFRPISLEEVIIYKEKIEKRYIRDIDILV